MKQLAHIILFLFALFICKQVFADYPKAPDFELQTQNGSIHLSNLQGKVVYVDFWASWCRPCKTSFPWMIEMKEKFSQMNFEIIAINLDTNKTLADEFIATQKINFPVAFDPQAKTAGVYGVEGMPSSFLIDPQGNLRLRFTGFWNKSKNEKEKIIHDLLTQFKDAH